MPSKLMNKIIGAAVGVVIGLMMLFIGLWKTLLLVALGATGWWVCGGRPIPQPVKQKAEMIFRGLKEIFGRISKNLSERL